MCIYGVQVNNIISTGNKVVPDYLEEEVPGSDCVCQLLLSSLPGDVNDGRCGDALCDFLRDRQAQRSRALP